MIKISINTGIVIEIDIKIGIKTELSSQQFYLFVKMIAPLKCFYYIVYWG